MAAASDEQSYIACVVISLIRLDGYDQDGSKKKALAAGFDALGVDLAELRAEQLRLLKEKAKPSAKPASKLKKRVKAAV